MKFNVGDRVVCVDAGSGEFLVVGGTYTVTEVCENAPGGRIRVGNRLRYCDWRFRPCEPGLVAISPHNIPIPLPVGAPVNIGAINKPAPPPVGAEQEAHMRRFLFTARGKNNEQLGKTFYARDMDGAIEWVKRTYPELTELYVEDVEDSPLPSIAVC